MTGRPCGAAAPSRSATTRRTASSSAPRASSQPVTRLAMALTPPGSTRTLPTVATQPCRVGGRAGGEDERRRAEHGVLAVVEPGGAGVVGLAGDVEPPAAVRPDVAADPHGGPAWSRSTSARPCSTCSSTKAPTRRKRLVVGGRAVAGSRPAARIASAIVVPSASRSARARSAGSAPVITREPAQATPNRAPSSSPKLATPSGTPRREPAVAQRVDGGEGADTTPSGPSNAPPSGTESRCDPSDHARRPPRPRPGHPTRPTGCPPGPRRGRARGRRTRPANHSRRCGPRGSRRYRR